MAKTKKKAGASGLTDAQYEALSSLAWADEIWWHDLPAGAREILHRRRYLREARPMRCNTPGHRHPGYVTASQAGLDALNREAARRGHSRLGPGRLPQAPKSRQQLEREISATLRRR